MSATAQFIEGVRERTDVGLGDLIEQTEPESLYEPVRHVLEGRGKRFRSLLVHCAAESFGGPSALALSAGLAVEVFHCFTLVHDDIMDCAEERRGRPTVHVKWDESTAILCGDFLQGLSVELLLDYPSNRLQKVLHRYAEAVRRLCEGQVRDMEFESRSDVTLEQYVRMIDQKTAALFKLSLSLGGLTGRAAPGDLDVLGQIGHHLGRAFQIQDDYLDLTATDGRWGKPVGGDIVAGKKTFLTLKARELDSDSDSDMLTRLMTPGSCSYEDIEDVREYLDGLGVLEAARSTVIFHSSEARSLMKRLPEGLGRAVLLELTDRMEQRLH